eukprot:2269216-Amphidinium_carterae.2
MKTRALLVQLWQMHPEALSATADSEGMSSKCYLDSIASNYWGGLPECSILEHALCLRIKVHTSLDPVDRDHDQCQLRLWNQHYTV